jgi:glycerol-3-phosphate dehydrogenase
VTTSCCHDEISYLITIWGAKVNKKINPCMKRYKATVNAAGMWVETILYAQNQVQAYKLFQAIFGSNNVPHQPIQIS